MNSELNKVIESVKKQKSIPAVSGVFADGTVLETVYDAAKQRTSFVIWKDGAWHEDISFSANEHQCFVPYSAHNNLIKNEVVLLPSGAEDYGSDEELLSDIQEFIHHYLDVSPLFERIASYYVLFSWVYDNFNELPYLRFRGDFGSGKTRGLLILGSLCYKPIFASGASTVSPLFRIIDTFRGTLIIDEGDFRFSDERAEIVKILNNGNAKGFPVLRSEPSIKKGEFDPRAYQVYGPKLVATRGLFEDRALESRCITEEMGQSRLRDDVPINLPSAYKDEALHLRNKLLLFRFRNLHKRTASESLVDRTIEPRLNQIFVPLLSIIEDPEARRDLQHLARQYNRELIVDRGMDIEAQILEIIRDMLRNPYSQRLTVKDITNMFIDQHGIDYERKVTTKWIGTIIRKKLHLKTAKSNGVYTIPITEMPKLDALFQKYGVTDSDADNAESPDASSKELHGDFGDVGEVPQGVNPEASGHQSGEQ